jgi:hypothetical protein
VLRPGQQSKLARGAKDEEHACHRSSICNRRDRYRYRQELIHVVGHDKRGAIILRQKWSRGQVKTRLANLPPCIIGMGACVGAHHLSRKLRMPGARCSSDAAKCVRPYSKGIDFRDAAAIAEAVQRQLRSRKESTNISLPHRTDHGRRSRQRIRSGLRGLLERRSPRSPSLDFINEFGFVLPKTAETIKRCINYLVQPNRQKTITSSARAKKRVGGAGTDLLTCADGRKGSADIQRGPCGHQIQGRTLPPLLSKIGDPRFQGPRPKNFPRNGTHPPSKPSKP